MDLSATNTASLSLTLTRTRPYRPAGRKGLFGVKNAHAELIELINMIYEEGFKYDDGTVAIPFGILFQVGTCNYRALGLVFGQFPEGLGWYYSIVRGRRNGN